MNRFKSPPPFSAASLALTLALGVATGCPTPVEGDPCKDYPDAEECQDVTIDLEPARLFVDPPFGVGFDCVSVGCEEEKTFAVQNNGERDMAISLIRTSVDSSLEFSLTLYKLSAAGERDSPIDLPSVENPLIIGAGGARELVVTYRPTDAVQDEGEVLISWFDAINDYDDAIIENAALPLSTRVLGEAEATLVTTELNFGYSPVGVAKTMNIEVQNISNGTAILAVDAPILSAGSDAAFTFNVTETQYVNPGESGLIEVTFIPDALDAFAGEVYFATNDGANPQFNVRLLGTAIADPYFVVVEPADWTVNFGAVRVGDLVVRDVTIKNLGGLPLLVTPTLPAGVEQGFGMAVADGAPLPVLNPLDELTIQLSITPAVGGELAGEIVFSTNDPTLPEDWVDLVAFGIAPDAVMTPAALDFGNIVQTWSAEAQTVTVVNGGTGELEVTALEWEVGSSSQIQLVEVPPLPVKLGDGESLEFSVIAQANTIGSANATLLVHTDSITEPVRSLLVTANIVSCEVGCPMDNATASCNSGQCAVGTCSTGFHDADESWSSGCECSEDVRPDGTVADVGSSCFAGVNVGPLGDKCSDYPNQTTRTGTLHSLDDIDLYHFFADDDSGFPPFGCDGTSDSFEVRAWIENAPPGVEFCYRSAGEGGTCGGENQWSCGHTNKRIAEGGTGFGGNDSTYVTVWVRWAPGSAPMCGNYTITFKSRD